MTTTMKPKRLPMKHHHASTEVQSSYLHEALGTVPEEQKLRARSPWRQLHDDACALLEAEWERQVTKFGTGFDCIAVTGTSGLLIGPAVADTLGIGLVVIRKANDGSHNRGEFVEGMCGTSEDRVEGRQHGYVIVDDFMDSGRTIARVVYVMHRLRRDFEYRGFASYKRKEWQGPAINSKGIERQWLWEEDRYNFKRTLASQYTGSAWSTAHKRWAKTLNSQLQTQEFLSLGEWIPEDDDDLLD